MVEAAGVRHEPAPRVDVVDTTGAGAAFIGAFSARWVEAGCQHGDLVGAVEAAVRYAADPTMRAGAQASYADRRSNL